MATFKSEICNLESSIGYLGICDLLSCSVPFEMKFVRFHIRAPTAKTHPLSFQPQPLFDCRIAA
jgi:hypothetical protein